MAHLPKTRPTRDFHAHSSQPRAPSRPALGNYCKNAGSHPYKQCFVNVQEACLCFRYVIRSSPHDDLSTLLSGRSRQEQVRDEINAQVTDLVEIDRTAELLLYLFSSLFGHKERTDDDSPQVGAHMQTNMEGEGLLIAARGRSKTLHVSITCCMLWLKVHVQTECESWKGVFMCCAGWHRKSSPTICVQRLKNPKWQLLRNAKHYIQAAESPSEHQGALATAAAGGAGGEPRRPWR
jgi:hypothetical protein